MEPGPTQAWEPHPGAVHEADACAIEPHFLSPLPLYSSQPYALLDVSFHIQLSFCIGWCFHCVELPAAAPNLNIGFCLFPGFLTCNLSGVIFSNSSDLVIPLCRYSLFSLVLVTGKHLSSNATNFLQVADGFSYSLIRSSCWILNSSLQVMKGTVQLLENFKYNLNLVRLWLRGVLKDSLVSSHAQKNLVS
jgi:hypothetical protein